MKTRLGVDVDALERELREAVDGEVRFDDGTLAAYSTDASNYRQVPSASSCPGRRTPRRPPSGSLRGIARPCSPAAAAPAWRASARTRRW